MKLLELLRKLSNVSDILGEADVYIADKGVQNSVRDVVRVVLDSDGDVRIEKGPEKPREPYVKEIL